MEPQHGACRLAIGRKRRHGCSCPYLACPAAALQKSHQRCIIKKHSVLSARGGHRSPSHHFSRMRLGDRIAEIHMVEVFLGAGETCKREHRDHQTCCKGFLEQKRLARAGIELWEIHLFARWQIAITLQYVREAPCRAVTSVGDKAW